MRYSFEKDPNVMKYVKEAFTELREDGVVGVIDFWVAAKASAHSDLSALGSLHNFIGPEMFVREIMDILSYMEPPVHLQFSNHRRDASAIAGNVVSQSYRYLVAEKILMNLHCLTRHTSDFSIILGFFEQSGRLVERLRYYIFY